MLKKFFAATLSYPSLITSISTHISMLKFLIFLLSMGAEKISNICYFARGRFA